jgi:hypothetical protein
MMHYDLELTAGGVQVSLEPQLYCVPRATTIGALKFDEGIFVNTGLRIWNFEASATVLVRVSQGISVDGSMERLVIGSPRLFCLSSTDGKRGPRLSVASFAQPEQADPNLRGPHFLLDGQVNLLGLRRQLYVSVSTQGFAFEMSGALTPAATYDLQGQFDGPTNFGANGSVQVAIGTVDLGPLGKASIDSGVQGVLAVAVQGATAWANFKGGCRFAGKSLELPKLDLALDSDSLLDLSQNVARLVLAALQHLLADATYWAQLVGQGVLTGVADVAQVLKSVFGKSTAEAGAAVMRAAGYSAEQVARGLRSAYALSADRAARVLRDAGYAATEVGGALKSAYGVAADQAAKLLRGVGYAADEVGKALKTAFGATADQAAKLLRGAGFAATEVAGVLRNGYGLSVEQGAKLLQTVGYAANETGQALVSVWRASADGVGRALKGAGYAVDQVGGFLKDAFKLGPKPLERALSNAGFSQSSIKGFFKSLGGAFKDVFEEIGEKLNPTKW